MLRIALSLVFIFSAHVVHADQYWCADKTNIVTAGPLDTSKYCNGIWVNATTGEFGANAPNISGTQQYHLTIGTCRQDDVDHNFTALWPARIDPIGRVVCDARDAPKLVPN